MKGHVVYAKVTGLEVVAITRSKKKGDYMQKWGALRLRFFEMGGQKRSIKVLCDTVEAHRFSRVIKQVVKQKPEKPVQVLIHTYEKDGKKVTTTVSVEYWSRNGKEGFAILLKQKNGDEIKINVPVSKDEFLFLSDLLQHLAMEQSWFTSVKEEVEEEVTETPSSPGSVEEVDDLEDIDDIDL